MKTRPVSALLAIATATKFIEGDDDDGGIWTFQADRCAARAGSGDRILTVTGWRQAGSPPGSGKGRSKAKNKSASAKGKPAVTSGLAAEQVREARETNQAKNAEGSIRDRMVDIGRGNQQAGRQRAK